MSSRLPPRRWFKPTGAVALADVAKRHPLVFSGTFIHSLMALQKQAQEAGEPETVALINNRLRHLQLLQLGQHSRAWK